MRLTSNSAVRQRRDIEDELGCEPSLDARQNWIAVEDGVFTLSGHVAGHAEKVAAALATARVHGLKAIFGELEVA